MRVAEVIEVVKSSRIVEVGVDRVRKEESWG